MMANNNVYVSYAWQAERETRIVDRLVEACRNRGVELHRDITHLGYGKSIRAFMDELGAARHVVVVLSDKYLRSDYCMYELREIHANQSFRERVLPVVIEQTRIFKPADRTVYLEYWESEIAQLKVRLAAIDRAHTKNLNQSLDDYSDFRRLMDDYLAVLADMNSLTQDVHVDTNFEALLERLAPRISARAVPSHDRIPAHSPDEEHQEFERRFAREVGNLLRQPSLSEFVKTLSSVVSAEHTTRASENDPAAIATRMAALWWQPDDPSKMLERLTEGASRHLRLLRERGNPLTPSDVLWRNLVRLFGHVLPCFVSRPWLASRVSTTDPTHNVAVEYQSSVAIVSARLARIPAVLDLTVDQQVGPVCNLNVLDDLDKSAETFLPEVGWRVEPAVKQIEQLVYLVVFGKRKDSLTKTDRNYLNETLRTLRNDPEETRDFHAAVDRHRQSHPLLVREVAKALRDGLDNLPIFHYGPKEEENVFIIDEGVLTARVHAFLRLMQRHG